MAHKRDLVPPPTLQADRDRVDRRWPVPYALLFVTVVSVILWSLIIPVAYWLIG